MFLSKTTNKCVDKCSENEYVNAENNTCIQCNSNCATCVLSYDYCVTCNENLFLLTDLHRCVTNCLSGYTLEENNTCIPTNFTDRLSNCSVMLNGNCTTKCPDKMYADENREC